MKILLILLYFWKGEAHLEQKWYTDLDLCIKEGQARVAEQYTTMPGLTGIYADCMPIMEQEVKNKAVTLANTVLL